MVCVLPATLGRLPAVQNRVAERIVGTKGVAEPSSGMITGANPFRMRESPNPYVQEHTDLITAIRTGTAVERGQAAGREHDVRNLRPHERLHGAASGIRLGNERIPGVPHVPRNSSLATSPWLPSRCQVRHR